MSISIVLSPDELELLLSLVLLIAGVVFARYVAGLRRQAAAHDHVVEVTNDFVVPQRCLRCASPHAPFTFLFGTVTGSRVSKENVYGMRRRFQFQFCVGCARRIRRRRRAAALMVVGGPLLPVAVIGLMILAPKSIWAHLPGPDTFYLILVVLLILAAPVWIGAGIRLQQTSPSVMILDTGEGKLLFRFKSQMYRNYFAELNGEDFRRAGASVRPI
jgi:hypothetical protein